MRLSVSPDVGGSHNGIQPADLTNINIYVRTCGGLSFLIHKDRTISYSQRFWGCLPQSKRIAKMPIASENALSLLNQKDRQDAYSQ
jgi:hypothetical protein